ncbi:thiosulfate sulfurtransferase/rhodanese-like domain-containing protein 3 isoform X2 [Hemicordylus capensis]|uniref:thiosulfate sulfurtransferase/rhodanese-like domain-containing protein 3 isoform X2 n=1 Tax=Hemicordylus capensis TaxID=884348 RepID=UPI002302DD92|nr:thiosulfate sulfurtransferase/rhodanese-like domain-containing protein 3 isoform X2 [Hemicordylus capensis]
MLGSRRRLGWVVFLITQRTAAIVGSGPRFSVRNNQHSFPRQSESAASKDSLCNSGYLNTGRASVCNFCTAEDHAVSYEELKDLLESRAILLIDVREKWEVKDYGKIPGSISIPLGEVVEALQMDPVHFKERYNQDMPSKSDHIVFSCMAGVRSKEALAAAKNLGFSQHT